MACFLGDDLSPSLRFLSVCLGPRHRWVGLDALAPCRVLSQARRLLSQMLFSKSSVNTGLLRLAAKSLPPGVTMEIIDCRLPLYDGDLEKEGASEC